MHTHPRIKLKVENIKAKANTSNVDLIVVGRTALKKLNPTDPEIQAKAVATHVDAHTCSHDVHDRKQTCTPTAARLVPPALSKQRDGSGFWLPCVDAVSGRCLMEVKSNCSKSDLFLIPLPA